MKPSLFKLAFFLQCFVLAVNTFVPLVVCITVSLILVCYLKGHNITGDINYGKAVTKLGLFLLINSISSTIIGVLAYFTGESGAVALIYYIYAIGLLYTPLPYSSSHF